MERICIGWHGRITRYCKRSKGRKFLRRTEAGCARYLLLSSAVRDRVVLVQTVSANARTSLRHPPFERCRPAETGMRRAAVNARIGLQWPVASCRVGLSQAGPCPLFAPGSTLADDASFLPLLSTRTAGPDGRILSSADWVLSTNRISMIVVASSRQPLIRLINDSKLAW